MIGNRTSDVEAGRTAGCRTILIDRGYIDEPPGQADDIVTSIAEATSIVLRRLGQPAQSKLPDGAGLAYRSTSNRGNGGTYRHKV
jgi:hypothetical protein